jgi:hypothetical protein
MIQISSRGLFFAMLKLEHPVPSPVSPVVVPVLASESDGNKLEWYASESQHLVTVAGAT